LWRATNVNAKNSWNQAEQRARGTMEKTATATRHRGPTSSKALERTLRKFLSANRRFPRERLNKIGLGLLDCLP
jgi:hypothetical protein